MYTLYLFLLASISTPSINWALSLNSLVKFNRVSQVVVVVPSPCRRRASRFFSASPHSPNNDHTDDLNSEPTTPNNLENSSSVDMTASVRRKKKNSQYTTPVDNRDSLPFVVKVVTPDPYTHPEQWKQRARVNTKMERQKHKEVKNTGDLSSITIYTRSTDGSLQLQPVLGEFFLDKTTNCGDFIRIGEREYIVEKVRCQYKYAGGRRFTMVRKVLEVKETMRVVMEQFIQQNFDAPPIDNTRDFNLE